MEAYFSSTISSLLLTHYDIKDNARYADDNYYEKYDLTFFRKQVKILEKEIELI